MYQKIIQIKIIQRLLASKKRKTQQPQPQKPARSTAGKMSDDSLCKLAVHVADCLIVSGCNSNSLVPELQQATYVFWQARMAMTERGKTYVELSVLNQARHQLIGKLQETARYCLTEKDELGILTNLGNELKWVIKRTAPAKPAQPVTGGNSDVYSITKEQMEEVRIVSPWQWLKLKLQKTLKASKTP